MKSIDLAELPRPVRDMIARKAGVILEQQRAQAGPASPLAVHVRTPDEQLFIKGAPDTPGAAAVQLREFDLSPHLAGIAPAARWQVRAGGWTLVAHDLVGGARRASYHPDSTALPAVAALLGRLSTVEVPEGVVVHRAEQRLGGYGTTDEVRHISGRALLHTHLDPSHILITTNGAVRLVSWGRAMHGAPWLDAASWAIWLVAYGHSPVAAEEWARMIPAYRTARPEARRAYARISAAWWADLARTRWAMWTSQIARAAATWATHCTR